MQTLLAVGATGWLATVVGAPPPIAEAERARQASAGGGLGDQSFPIVSEWLDAELDDGERDDLLEADHAGGQMNLSEPLITDLDGGADVHVRLGDRALAARMPVVGDELAVFVSDGVEVADDLDIPACGALANLVLLGDEERETWLGVQPRGVAAGEQQAVRMIGRVVAADKWCGRWSSKTAAALSAAIVLDGLGGIVIWRVPLEREHHCNARDLGAVVYIDLARVQTPLELLAAHAQQSWWASLID